MRTVRGIEFRVGDTGPKHEGLLGPITLVTEARAVDLHWQTYLTADEAAELGAALSAAALKHDIEVLSKAALTPAKEPGA